MRQTSGNLDDARRYLAMACFARGNQNISIPAWFVLSLSCEFAVQMET
jgi:hypothetical protein